MDGGRMAELLEVDRWTLASGEAPLGVCVVRFREPVLSAREIVGFARCLRIVWEYAPEGLGEMPNDETSERLEAFEIHLCAAIESDRTAILTAVLTFDGARQWVFYTDRVDHCGLKINSMPQADERYPIELEVFDDPEWSYLREQVLKRVRRELPA